MMKGLGTTRRIRTFIQSEMVAVGGFGPDFSFERLATEL